MPDQSKLEIIALQKRNDLVAINEFDGVDLANGYSATHTKALADDATPEHGRGTGGDLDTLNYNAGTHTDRYGNVEVPGSGRAAAFANNGSTWGYTPGNGYTTPDTSGNIGQYGNE